MTKYMYLNVTEWLEARRLRGCEWAPELLELLDAQDDAEANAGAIEDITYLSPWVDASPAEIAEWVQGEIHLLDEIREIVEEHCQDVRHTNGTELIDIADKLRAAFESGRWSLEYDL